MRIIRASEHRRMPWKNGGGETSEIAAFPEGADMASFGWRISMARVASDGPFSPFPEVDRTLTILEGDGLVLSVAGRNPVTLDRQSAPHVFSGDVPTSATLKTGPVLDLNVMTRRSQFTHGVEKLEVKGSIDLALADPVCIVICADGTFQCILDGTTQQLMPHDCIILHTMTTNSCTLQGDGMACIIFLKPVS